MFLPLKGIFSLIKLRTITLFKILNFLNPSINMDNLLNRNLVITLKRIKCNFLNFKHVTTLVAKQET